MSSIDGIDYSQVRANESCSYCDTDLSGKEGQIGSWRLSFGNKVRIICVKCQMRLYDAIFFGEKDK